MTDRAKLEEAIRFYTEASPEYRRGYSQRRLLVLAAAEAHLSTLPKTKTVDVWRVEFAHAAHPGKYEPGLGSFNDEASARAAAHKYSNFGYHCIRVTGPHQQEVPA